jgi:selenide,water dikinase
MHTTNQEILRNIVLVGGGHSHVNVIRKFGIRPWLNVRLILICTDIHTPYSGMLPGYIAGHYTYDDVHIDLVRLCAFAGALFFKDEVVNIDRINQKVICKNRSPIAYDVLSINIGSTPQIHKVIGAFESSIPVKPIAKFNQHWLELLERIKSHPSKTTIAVIGGGAGGVELTLAMQYRLNNELRLLGRNPNELEFHLFTANIDILPTHNSAVRIKFEKVLENRGIHVHRNSEIIGIDQLILQTKQGDCFFADEIIWVTQAGGSPWLKKTGLELNQDGFINVKQTLQTISDPKIFAAGDIANLTHTPLEKAGVFAVRMGKPLAKNLYRFIRKHDLLDYHPQKKWLALISTGNKYAVASRGVFCFSGFWVWQWKDLIDRWFMARFRELPSTINNHNSSIKKQKPLD